MLTETCSTLCYDVKAFLSDGIFLCVFDTVQSVLSTMHVKFMKSHLNLVIIDISARVCHGGCL